MKRLLSFGFLPLAGLLLLLAMTGFVSAKGLGPNATLDGEKPQPFQPPLPALEGVSPDQYFEHLRGGQFTVTDAQGNAVTYAITAGTVATVSDTAVSVTPNATTTPMSFNITPNTRVRGSPPRGSLQVLAQGDKVVVISQPGANGTNDAIGVAKHNFAGFHPHMYGGMAGPGMMGNP